MSRTIDMTPTWGEWARIYQQLAESGERNALVHLRSDFARMAASAEALKAVMDVLDDKQLSIVSDTMTRELTKLGF